MDDTLSYGAVTEKAIRKAAESDLLQLLPLALLPPICEGVQTALKERIETSRVVKLRFLLLCERKEYAWLKVKRRYSSSAYQLTGAGWSGDGRDFELLVDMVDLQSLGFYGDDVFDRDTVHGGIMVVGHVFGKGISGGRVDDGCGEFAYGKERAGTFMVGLKRMGEGDGKVEEIHMECTGPMVGVWEGKGLVVVVARLLMRMCNCIWTKSESVFGDVAGAPFCDDQDFAVARRGVLEKVWEKWFAIASFNFEYWRYTKGLSPVVADSMVRSAAGIFVSMYVFGIDGEIGVIGGKVVGLGQINRVFMEHIGKGGVSSGLREALKKLGFWDIFFETCVKGFVALRERYEEALSPLWKLMEAAGFSREEVLQVVAGKHGLNIAESRQDKACANFRRWLQANVK